MAEARFQAGGPRTIRVEGEVDTSNSDALAEALHGVTEGNGNGDVVVDMEGLTFIDSSGFRVLIQAARSLEGRGRLVLRSAPPLVERLFHTLGLSSMEQIVMEPSAQPSSGSVAADGGGSGSGSQR
jgi:stage II sporulation protein AA (anti-sigma F factor antagonist)